VWGKLFIAFFEIATHDERIRVLDTIQEEIRKELSSEEADVSNVPGHLHTACNAVPGEPPVTTRKCVTISIHAVEQSQEMRPEFFAFPVKFYNFIRSWCGVQSLDGSEVNWVGQTSTTSGLQFF
jgi:hypothetical protein